MPDTRTHRGPHPRDAELFAEPQHVALRSATAELGWLLTRGYKNPSALKLVGDRHGLTVRQREAVLRAACSDQALERRRLHRLEKNCLEMNKPSELWIDGFNVLMSIEVALSGGVLLHARDDCFRDLASVHGSYRKVDETEPAVQMLLAELSPTNMRRIRLLLDAPVSNSGRLAQLIRDCCPQDLRLEVELHPKVDQVLSRCEAAVASADSGILDAGVRWINLARQVIEKRVPEAWVVDMRSD